LGECLKSQSNEEYRALLVLGYASERNTVPKINSVSNFSEEVPYTRKGEVKMSLNEGHKGSYEDC
jgi:hypothetical protein